MSFPFGSSSSGGASKGPDLETIQTEALGFLSIAGDAKVRLTSSWSSLPAATSSLLSVASRRGLVAAAGPDHIIIATTAAIRKAFEAPKDGDADVRSFEPQLNIPMPMRVSQLVFTADEKHLVLSAESGGGLAVYEVESLLQGSSASAFELSTNGEALRALAPNPTPEKAELVAIVTDGGNLHMANLGDRSISSALKSQVSCVSWSSKGKQLCAGLADGSIHQMTPEGEGKAEIPLPPGQSNSHVSSLTWLENNVFLAIHTTADSPPTSTYHVITRQSPGAFEFRRLADPIEPFGSEKTPHHTLLRLRDFPPDLQDLLIVTSTASTEVGLLTRAKSPLTSDKPADSITGVFTTTELLDDTRRPTLPMTDSFEDSTAVGIALDLSATDKVYKPIPSDPELEESPSPLPGFWILTHEGILCSWWLVYTDSIKQKTTYPGLSIAQGTLAEQAAAPSKTPTNPFSSSLSGPSLFAPSTGSGAAFGSAASLGQKASPWAASAGAGGTPSSATTGGATFGSSTFGSAPAAAAFGQSTFGQSTQIGAKSSLWGSGGSGAATSSTPAFGQSGFSSFAGKSTTSPFGASVSVSSQAPSAAPASGGFAGFASSGGFASLAGSNTGPSLFSSSTSGKPAGIFGSSTTDTAFPSKSDSEFGASQIGTGAAFGSPDNKPETPFGSSPFKLQSSFKPDTSVEEEEESAKPSGLTGLSMFGSSFGSALTAASAEPASATASAKDEDMDTADAGLGTPGVFGSTASAGSLFGQTAQPDSGLFGSTTKTIDTAPAKPNLDVFGSAIAAVKPDAAPLQGFEVKAKKSVTFLEPVSIEAAETPRVVDVTETESAEEPEVDESLPEEQQPEEESGAFESSLISEPDSAIGSPGLGPSEAAVDQTPDAVPLPPQEDGESDLEEDDDLSEGSGVDVAKDLSPTISGMVPSLSSRGSFGGLGGPSIPIPVPARPGAASPLSSSFGADASAVSGPRSASPRGPVASPKRLTPADFSKSAMFPSMASPMPGVETKSPLSMSVGSKAKPVSTEDFLAQQKLLKERQEAEEQQLLIDEEDEEMQRVLASEIEPTLDLDEFIAHSNVAPPAKDSIPAQVEAVYRDINSMIDTLGLNARSVKAFMQGHLQRRSENGRSKDDLEEPDGWVLCEISDLGDVIEEELPATLADGRVVNLPEKLEACQDLARELHRLRAKQGDLQKVISTRLDPAQADFSQSLPLSTEQATQQNELRREYNNLSKSLSEAEEALTLLKTRIASIASSTGRGNGNVPTVEAVMRTIAKMTSMVEKRSGDIDVLETQLRKLRLDSLSREGSPLRTPQQQQQQLRRSLLMSLDSTPTSRAASNMASSIMSFGGGGGGGGAGSARGTPKKKLSGFSREEKVELMERRGRRQGVLAKLRESVEKKGVKAWTMEDDIE